MRLMSIGCRSIMGGVAIGQKAEAVERTAQAAEAVSIQLLAKLLRCCQLRCVHGRYRHAGSRGGQTSERRQALVLCCLALARLSW